MGGSGQKKWLDAPHGHAVVRYQTVKVQAWDAVAPTEFSTNRRLRTHIPDITHPTLYSTDATLGSTRQTRPPPHPPRLRGEQTPHPRFGAIGRGHSVGEPQKWRQLPQTAVQPGTQPMEVPMGNPDAGANGIVRPPCHGGPFSDGRGQ